MLHGLFSFCPAALFVRRDSAGARAPRGFFSEKTFDCSGFLGNVTFLIKCYIKSTAPDGENS
jgi:hypothetical protein